MPRGPSAATYHGRPCGSFGDVSIFSFNGNKTVTAGGGGMVLTDDEAMARFVRHVSTQARPTREYIHDQIGFNYRMTNLNAAVGLAQIERLGEMVAAKRAIAARYDAALAGRADIVADAAACAFDFELLALFGASGVGSGCAVTCRVDG